MLYQSKCGSLSFYLFHDIKQFCKGVYFRIEGFDLAEACLLYTSVEVLDVQETTRKEDAKELFRYL